MVNSYDFLNESKYQLELEFFKYCINIGIKWNTNLIIQVTLVGGLSTWPAKSWESVGCLR